MENIHTIDRDPPPEHEHEIRMELWSAKISALAPEQLEQILQQLEMKLGLENTYGIDTFAPIRNGMRIFTNELDSNGMPQNIDLDRIQEHKRKYVKLISELYHRSSELGIKDQASKDINGDEFRIAFRLTRLIETVDDAYEILFRYIRSFDRINSPTLAPISDSSLFRCKTLDDPEDADETSPYQKLLL